MKHFIPCAAAVLCAAASTSQAIEYSGFVALESRIFTNGDETTLTGDNLSATNISAVIEPEFYHQFANSRNSFTFTPYLRIDENDSERTHADIREMVYHLSKRDWELRLGVSKVFWGVTETGHLVDIINQTDLVENLDGEDKLGQAMANLTVIRSWGNLDFFILPVFRERTFSGPEGRPVLTPLPVSNDIALYESSAESGRVDYAVRWSHYHDEWEWGISHFSGTTREPRFDSAFVNVKDNGDIEIIPIYEVIDQTGIDIQGTFESWIFKFEGITRSGQEGRFSAAILGTEYTFYDIASSGVDIGIVTEYLHDDRDGPTGQPLDADITFGMRLALNDVQSTEMLLAFVTDVNNGTLAYFVEASRRIGSSYKLTAEIRGSSNVDTDDPLIFSEDEDFFQLEFSYHY